ncbi:MAG: flagellar basal body-associated FliL family protein [Anaeromyxobacteraceae bacterium]
MAEEADKDIEKAAGVGAGGGSKLVPILLIVNVVLVAAVLAVFLLRGGGGSHPETKPDDKAAEHGKEGEGKGGEKGKDGKEAPPGPTVKLADFVVHLRNVESDRYARLSFEVEVAAEEDKNKFTLLMPRVRDGFLLYLSDRTLEELRGGEAIARTKKALEERLPELAPGVKINALYVTDLVIQ